MGLWGEPDDGPETSEQRREAANAIAQFDLVVAVIEAHCATPVGEPFVVNLALLSDLNHRAMDGLIPSPGEFRQRDVVIDGSRHIPPPWAEVPLHVREMIATINQWNRFAAKGELMKPAVAAMYAASFALWRLNWIHPFDNGNGRTSRALAYLLLCANVRKLLPGRISVAERIDRNRFPYTDALEAADNAYLSGEIDITLCLDYLTDLAIEQITDEP